MDPGTNQVCLFRDSYEPLTATGLDIYGLSNDSPKANTTFKTKQNLPYPLLCDPGRTLISAIGMKKAPNGTTRGVFVVDKSGQVLAAEAGGPAATVDVVKALVMDMGAGGDATEAVMEVSEAVGLQGPSAPTICGTRRIAWCAENSIPPLPHRLTARRALSASKAFMPSAKSWTPARASH